MSDKIYVNKNAHIRRQEALTSIIRAERKLLAAQPERSEMAQVLRRTLSSHIALRDKLALEFKQYQDQSNFSARNLPSSVVRS